MDTTRVAQISSNVEKANLSDSYVIPSLNGLRGISVLLVIIAHAGFGQIVPGGLGVTIFFFLSGYLITTLLLSEFDKNGKIDIWSFYARRIFRLAPPLVITLTVAYILAYTHVLPPVEFNFEALLSQLFCFANYYRILFDNEGTTAPMGTGVTMVLAVVEQFYIVYPLVLILFLKMKSWPVKFAAALASTVVLVLCWRIYLVQSGASEVRTYYATDTRIDSILFGCMLSIWVRLRLNRRSSTNMSFAQWALFALSLIGLLFTIFYRNAFFRETFRYSLQGIALTPIIYYSIVFYRNLLFRYLNTNWITKLGVYSYFIYLIHLVIISAINTRAPAILTKPLVILPVALAISIAYAAVIDRYIDPYFRYLRRKFRPPSRPKPTVAGVLGREQI